MKLLKELLPYIIILIVVIIVRTFFVTPIIVNGDSMKPTLNENEILLLNKYDKEYERFDIVVIDKTVEGDNLIKRIIGLPGETIEYHDEKLYINDEEVKDNYHFGVTNTIDKIKLGNDEYFVMGDNRTISLDSRILGKIKYKQIKGTVKVTLFPFKKFGLIN